MSKRFIAITSGWIPVFVLVLLAAALASGQAREDHLAAAAPVTPAAIEVLIELPGDIEHTLDAVRLIMDAGHPTIDTTRNDRGAL